MRNCVIIVEGVTDSGVIECLIEKGLGFTRYNDTSQLNEFFKKLISPFPTEKGKLNHESSPMFFVKDNINVAVKYVGDCAKQAKELNQISEMASGLDRPFSDDASDDIDFLIFTDKDTFTENDKIIEKFTGQFNDIGMEYNASYIIKDDEKYAYKFCFIPATTQGAIEKVLLKCAEKVQPIVFEISKIVRSILSSPEKSELRSNLWNKSAAVEEFYIDKAQFGTITSI